ncbi:MAG: hypothetical protein RLZZ618_1228 [Pseudomonadota bacterium]|jgi:hypothetical protein
MNHIVITIIKWLFLAVGVGLLVLAANVPREARWILVALGLVFALIGGGIIGYGHWNAKKEAQLREHGHLVQAEFQQVELNESLEVNGTNPFRIIAQWHDKANNRLCIFKSANLWFDPTAFVQGRTIPVDVDLAKPSRYHVDTSFLPTVHS